MASPESFEVWATLRTKIQAEKGPPHPKIEKNKCVLNWLLGKIQCFKPMFFFSFLSGKSPVADPPPLSEKFHYFFLNPSLWRTLQVYFKMSFEQIMASDWSKVEQDKSIVFTSFHIHPSHQGQSSNGICYALNSSLFKRLSNTPPPPLYLVVQC